MLLEILMLLFELTTYVNNQCVDINLKNSDRHDFAFCEIFNQKLLSLSQFDDLRAIHDSNDYT
jgi:hypothetical protein